MWSSLVVIATTIVLWTPRTAGSLTSGFPSLDDIKGNASLLDKYTTYDGEMRSIPTLRVSASQECSTQNVTITRIIFIALPRAGNEDTELIITTTSGSNHTISLNEANPSFGYFGYELHVEPSEMLNLSDIEMFWISQPYYKDSSLRLLHQVGDNMFNIRWRWVDNSDDRHSETTYDYPLLAIETEPAGCIEGLVNKSELRNMWEYRPPPVRYTSPYREIPLVCSGTGSVNRILAGAYSAMSGDQAPHIEFGGNDHVCTLFTQPDAEDPNVYECMLDSPVGVDGSDSLYVHQRNTDLQIVFLYDGQEDFPLIFIDINGGECSSNGLISEDELIECASLYIPQFVFLENDLILFMQLIIKQPGDLVKWIFIAKKGEGNTEYPSLRVYRRDMEGNFRRVPNLSSSEPVLTNYTNVYECIIDTRFQVQAGDIIGLDLPENARLLLSIILNHGSVGGESLRGNRLIDGLPLVTLEIDPLPITIVRSTPSLFMSMSATYTTQQPSPTDITDPENTADPENTTDPESSSDNTGAIVGAIVGLIIAVILVLVIALLLVIVLRKKKEKHSVKEKGTVVTNSDANSHVPMDNPVYSGRATDPGRQGVDEPEYQAPSPPTSASTAMYEVLDNVQGGARKPKHEQSFDNPSYYSTLQDVHSTTDQHDGHNNTMMLSPNHYEMGIYVPTQEQRQYVETCHKGPIDNVYATLEETQAGSEGKTLSFFEECDLYWRPASTREDLYQQLAQKKYREIPRHQIQITDHLGSGQFGTVNRGVWQVGAQGGVEVAIKMLQEGTAEEDAVRFLQEAAINGQFRHPNIVELLGVVTVGKPVMIVLELLSNGDLRNYLLKHKPVPGELPLPDTARLLLQFCVQVARGMEYLSSKAFVHRDLAARNILITDDKKCKISDFGMSRDLEEGTYYVSQGGKVPVKWTAPEALHYKKYSTASDVWSFGCLMYEIWSLGHKPFEGYTNPDTIKLVDNGCRLAPPPGCPQEMYRLMITCWNADKSSRPQFTDIVHTLSQSEDQLLYIPEVVTRDHPQAAILGAPLEAGRNLYTQLQNTYMS